MLGLLVKGLLPHSALVARSWMAFHDLLVCVYVAPNTGNRSTGIPRLDKDLKDSVIADYLVLIPWPFLAGKCAENPFCWCHFQSGPARICTEKRQKRER